MPMPTGTLRPGLEARGFVRTSKADKVMTCVTRGGVRISVITHHSLGASGKHVADGVVGAMARQCKLTARQFRDLVKRDLSREEYERLLVEGGFMKRPNGEGGRQGIEGTRAARPAATRRRRRVPRPPDSDGNART